MIIALLKVELLKRDLVVAGSKPVFKERLLSMFIDIVVIYTDTDTLIYPNPEDGFNATANWIELIANKIPAKNPIRGHHVLTNRLDSENLSA